MTKTNHGKRYSSALVRVVAVQGDNTQTLHDFNAAISANWPRVDLIADQAEAYAAEIEWRAEVDANAADHADLIDTQECARA